MSDPSIHFPNFVHFICPKCEGTGKEKSDMFGEIDPCETCKGKGEILVREGIEIIVKSFAGKTQKGAPYLTEEALKQVKILMPLSVAHSGVNVTLDLFWYRRLEEWITEKL